MAILAILFSYAPHITVEHCVYIQTYTVEYLRQCSTSEIADLWATFASKVGIITVALPDIDEAFRYASQGPHYARLSHLGVVPQNVYTPSCVALEMDYSRMVAGMGEVEDVRRPMHIRIYLAGTQRTFISITNEFVSRLSLADQAQILWDLRHNR